MGGVAVNQTEKELLEKAEIKKKADYLAIAAKVIEARMQNLRRLSSPNNAQAK